MSIIFHFGTRFSIRNTSLLCGLFQAAAYDTWERIAFSRTRPRMKIHETTITQNIVYELNLLKWWLRMRDFSIYESTNEAANGDDMEICINQRGRVYKYAVQAKIIYHSLRDGKLIRLDDGVYKQFEHTVRERNQIDLLIEYAENERIKAIPLYLLYNYVASDPINGNICNIPYDITQYGCSLIGAHYLKANFSAASGNLLGNVRFSDIHPDHGIPWFLLTCCFPTYNLSQTFNTLEVPADYEVRSYSIEEIDQDRAWNLLGQYSESRTNNLNDKQISKGFSPKYRILIDINDSNKAI